MVSKGKEQVNLNTVTIKGVNKLSASLEGSYLVSTPGKYISVVDCYTGDAVWVFITYLCYS